MKFNYKHIFSTLALTALLSGCAGEEMNLPDSGNAGGKTIPVSLTVTRPGNDTRTALSESEEGKALASVWTSGDKLIITAENGSKVGELTLQEGEGTTEGVFVGEAAGVTPGAGYTVRYLGATTASGAPFVSIGETSGKIEFINALEQKGCVVTGLLGDLCRADLLKKEGVELAIADGMAIAKLPVELEHELSMVHFSLSGIPSELDNEATLTFDYGDYSYQISNIASEIYLPMIPGTHRIKFTLSNAGKGYEYEFDSEKTLAAGLYYTALDDDSHGVGIDVPLSEVEQSAPEIDEDVIGKVFEVNGKRFRFTRANLKFNVDTRAWSLMDRQYSFICRGGWVTSDGKWQKTKETEIDLFGFGATGLYDIESGETAQVPEFWRQTGTQTYTDAANYYPTNNTQTNQGSGFIGSYLEHGTQFTNFDWGKAYYLNKKGEAYPSESSPYTSYDKDNNPGVLRYFTLSSNDWEKLQSKYFFCGATITGITNPANTTAKNNIYGCLIFPITGEGANSVEVNKDKLAKVNALLTGRVTYLSTSLTTNLSFTGTNYQYFNYSWVKMTAAQFDELEKLGVVFLPEAGHRAPDSYTKTDAYYWTSTAGQQYVSTFFRFDGDSSPKVFKLEGINRSLGGSVRLVKEVPADYTDPMVVE